MLSNDLIRAKDVTPIDSKDVKAPVLEVSVIQGAFDSRTLGLIQFDDQWLGVHR
jgi:hypothetical protein